MSEFQLKDSLNLLSMFFFSFFIRTTSLHFHLQTVYMCGYTAVREYAQRVEECLCIMCMPAACLRVYMLCICVFARPGCVWRCQAIWSAVWGAHYPLSSAVGYGALSICPPPPPIPPFILSSLSSSLPVFSFFFIFLSFSLYFLELGVFVSFLS